jgi:sugar lactone lactonase YvrE
MKGLRRSLAALAAIFMTALAADLVIGAASARDDDDDDRTARPLGDDASWTTIFTSTLGIEGLTGDGRGNLYVAARGGGSPCPVYRVPVSGGSAAIVGFLTAPCGPAGLTFDEHGKLYVTGFGAAGDQIGVLTPNPDTPPTATLFATGVPGANGVAFDRRGNLWASDGGTARGRVWRIPPAGGAATEVFRIQMMANDVAGGVGRDNRSLPPGTITQANRQASNTLGSQAIVANGLAFTGDGELLVADTARGAIWHVELDRNGNVASSTGCDTTFTENTLCLDNLLAQHPYLEGADGIALDRAGTIFVAANERNAIAVVDSRGRVLEFFRNAPSVATQLRNEGPQEFPTSPFLSGRTLCVTQSDGNRRDNTPNSGGDVGPGHPAVGKISCLDQRLQAPGLPLPVR